MTMQIRPYADGDRDAILDLFEKTFGKPLSPDFWRWRFIDNPCDTPRIELAWDGDVLAAHYAVCPVALSIGGERRLTALSMTTMTHPDYRGRGLFTDLAAKLYQRLSEDGYAAVWGFPNFQSHRGFVKDLQWQDVCDIPTLQAQVRPPRALDANVVEVEQFDSRFDELWSQCRTLKPVAVWRDSTHLSWRFSAGSTNEYKTFVYLAGDGIAGYAVWKVFGETIDLVDLLVRDQHEGVTAALVGSVMNAAGVIGATLVSTWTALHTQLHLQLEKLGFRTAAPVTYLGVRPFQDSGHDLFNARNWWYAMQDSDVF